MSHSVDAVVIGSGHNGLVAAAYLARAGWSVEVLERNDAPGGAVATEELTAPGYRHDPYSSWHPLFHASAAWAELGDELRARGLDYANAEDVVTATVRRDGGAIVAHRDPARTAAAMSAADGAAYAEDLGALGSQMDVVGELLGTELQSPHALLLAGRLGRRLGVRDGLAFGARLVSSAREISITVNAGGFEHWKAIKAQQLFAEEVIPRFRGSAVADAEAATAGWRPR